jgi:amino acid transporter
MGHSDNEKYGSDSDNVSPGLVSPTVEDVELGEGGLKRSLKGRHMQMIAIGGSIGAGLFVGSGSALTSGGPASLVIDFIIIGIMLLLTINALGELACKPPTRTDLFEIDLTRDSSVPCRRIFLQLLHSLH